MNINDVFVFDARIVEKAIAKLSAKFDALERKIKYQKDHGRQRGRSFRPAGGPKEVD